MGQLRSDHQQQLAREEQAITYIQQAFESQDPNYIHQAVENELPLLIQGYNRLKALLEQNGQL